MSARRPRVWIALMPLALLLPQPAGAYLHIGLDRAGQSVAIKWDAQRVRWYASDRGLPGLTPSQFRDEVAQAFATWEAVPTASIGFDFAGLTSATPFDDDGLSVLGFEHQPDMDRVLGATTFLVDVLSGEIVEADVFFNSAFQWSVAPSGEAGRFDLRSVATHEIGHFLGLGHSAIGETELRPEGGRRVLGSGAVMFPISLGRGIVVDRALQPDDIAGVSDLYPEGDVEGDTGIITGRVRLNGAPVKGAHVVAFNPRTGALVGGLSGADGVFRVGRLTPGPHVLRVEPLDDADIESFLDPPGVNIDFLATFHPALVVAPRGGASASVDVTVRPK